MTNKYVALEGGLDLVTPSLEAKGGKCVTALNVYESVRGGYKAMKGYEAFDGLPSPSDVNRFSKPDGEPWKNEEEWQQSIEERRALIGQPPGDGPIRGIAQIQGVVLAWRNSGSKLKAYSATTRGWAEVPYRSGYDPYALVDTKIDYVNHNFLAGTNTYRMYFSDGANCMAYYDPWAHNITGIPEAESAGHVIAWQNRIVYSTTGGTLVISGAGKPDDFNSAVVDAAEIGVGDKITGFVVTASKDLAIYTVRTTFGLSGTTPQDWRLQMISQNSGSKPHCQAETDDIFASDDRGISRMSRVAALGGFASETISDDIQPLFRQIAQDASCATTIRSLNQMRFFYGNKAIIASRIEYNANGNKGIRYGLTEASYPLSTTVDCISTEEDANGDEKTYFGSNDGYVYQMDKGTSHNGEEIYVKVTLQFNHFGDPSVKKRFEGIGLEAVLASPTEFNVSYSMDDGQRTYRSKVANFPDGSSIYGSSEFGMSLFGSRPLSRDRIHLKGTGYNVQFSFSRITAFDAQASLTGYTIRYRERAQVSL